jgi:hypothetical protein
MGVPPLSAGTVHAIVIEVSEDFNRVGVPGCPGTVAAMAERILDLALSPTTFLALTLN